MGLVQFCGHQHAHMAMLVVAQPRPEFDRWYESQLAPAASPSSAPAMEGSQIFTHKACPSCHAIRGTDAAASVAPDLTHVGARATLAAGTLSNAREQLTDWIRDPHAVKPGVKMPPNALANEELAALVAYLEELR